MEVLKVATKTLQLAIQTAVDAIKTVVDATKTKVDTIDTRTTTINTNVDTANTSLNTLLAGRVVKSVQRGTAIGSGAATTTINISTINPAKSFVNLRGNSVNDDPSIVVSLTSNTLTIRTSRVGLNTTATNETSWEVIEFY